MLLDIREVWLRVLIRTHETQGINQDTLYTLLLKVVVYHVGRHDLTLRDDDLLLKACEDAFGERAHITEPVAEEIAGLLLVTIVLIQLLHVIHILGLQVVDDFVGTFGFFL